MPILLARWQRFVAAGFGLTASGVGGTAVFVTENQVGATALLLIGGIAFLMGLTGRVPDRIGKDGMAFEEVADRVTQAVDHVLTDETLPLPAREAVADRVRDQLDLLSGAAHGDLSAHNILVSSPGVPTRLINLSASVEAVKLESQILQVITANAPTGTKLVSGAEIHGYELDAVLYPGDMDPPLDPRHAIVFEFSMKVDHTKISRTLHRFATLNPRGIVFVTPTPKNEAAILVAKLDFQKTAKQLGLANAQLVHIDVTSAESLQHLARTVNDMWNGTH